MRGSTTLLGKGSRCAPPLHPSGPWLFLGIEPHPEPAERIPVQSVAGDFALPAPIDPFRKTMGLSRPLEPLAGLGDLPLHLHRTMHERLAVRSPIGEAFLLPPIPP